LAERAAAARVQQENGLLDVLIKNAGVFGDMTKAPGEDLGPAIKDRLRGQRVRPDPRYAGVHTAPQGPKRASIVMVSSGLGFTGGYFCDGSPALGSMAPW
jgi:NAD(P)-dependent dehydrogenase (short-subunit alcohol dehydrogenase family)